MLKYKCHAVGPFCSLAVVLSSAKDFTGWCNPWISVKYNDIV